MAFISKGIKLSYKASASGSTFTELTNLTEIPELGGSAEKLDITTLADGAKKYTNGIKDYGDLAFKFIFDDTQFKALNAIDKSTSWKVEIPAASGTGQALTATFSGTPSVSLEGAGVNAVLTYTLSISLDSEIAFA